MLFSSSKQLVKLNGKWSRHTQTFLKSGFCRFSILIMRKSEWVVLLTLRCFSLLVPGPYRIYMTFISPVLKQGQPSRMPRNMLSSYSLMLSFMFLCIISPTNLESLPCKCVSRLSSEDVYSSRTINSIITFFTGRNSKILWKHYFYSNELICFYKERNIGLKNNSTHQKHQPPNPTS